MWGTPQHQHPNPPFIYEHGIFAVMISDHAKTDHEEASGPPASARLTSSPSQSYVSSVAYAPFGETYAQSGTADVSFTGQNPDTTSGNYDFLAREYSIQGRWSSPDPAGLAAVDPSNPQSWNRYSYGFNSPLRFVDPLGLTPACYAVQNQEPGQSQDSKPGGPFADEADPGFGFQIPQSGCLPRDGGGGGTSMDGVDISDIPGLSGFLGSGASYGVCPNGNCTGIQAIQGPGGTTIIQQWYPPQTWTTGDDDNGYTIHQIIGGWQTISDQSPGWTLASSAGGGGNSSDSWAWTFTKTFFTNFSVFGDNNDPRPSCFVQFAKDAVGNFFGYSGADVAGGVGSATYILTPPSAVPPTMALRGGKYALNWIKANQAARVANAAKTGLLANLVFAEGLALGNEVDSALNGQCK